MNSMEIKIRILWYEVYIKYLEAKIKVIKSIQWVLQKIKEIMGFEG
jgi:hypothetical protein